MAFWGVKLKPKKPVIISEEELDGRRLHVTQATLGLLPESDENPQRSVVKCRAGDNPVIFMCSLKPGLHETVPLNLYFETSTAFSATGPVAVHLCGCLEDFTDDLCDDEEDMSDDEMDEDFVVSDDADLDMEDEFEDDEEEEFLEHGKKGHNVKIVDITEDEDKEKDKLAIVPSKATPKQNGETSEDEDGFPTKRKALNDDETPNKKAKSSDSPATPGTEPSSGKKKKKKGKKQDGEGSQPAEEAKPTPSSKGKSKSDKKRFPNGLEIENLSYGKADGKHAKPGKKVSIHYIGKLLKNGKIFDSTVGRKPFVFRLGINEVIKGFDIGVAGMRVGDKRKVTIPPAMGYGDKSVGPIPPHSWLCFDIELVEVK